MAPSLLLQKTWRFLRGSQGVLVVAALVVVLPTIMVKTAMPDIGGPLSLPTVRYKTVAEIASLDEGFGLTTDPNYNTEEIVTTLDGDYLFKTGAIQTIISRNNRVEVIEYEVKPGESLYTIAEGFGVAVGTVRYLNGLSSNTLKVGQKLKIPPVDGLFIKVKRGENISTIAQRYRIETDNIYKYNSRLEKDALIFAGQELFLPGAVVPKPSAGSGSKITAPSFIAGGTGKFIWPTSSPTRFISQGFGRTSWNRNHTGIDLNRLNGLGIYASAAGVVSSTISSRWGYGKVVKLNHGDGWSTWYAHLSDFRVRPGDYVQQGQLIGIMGSTGRSTGTHLHFEIRKNDDPLNPLTYLLR